MLETMAEYDGAGLGLAEFVLVLTEQGRRVCLAPLWETVVLGALTLTRYGTAAQRSTWLPRIASGSAIVPAALEDRGACRPWTPVVHATGSDGDWTLTGRATAVPSGPVADAVLVPAITVTGTVEWFLVGTDQPGVHLARVTKGRIIMKTGAEGFLLAYVPQQGLAAVLKIADGEARARVPALIALLSAVGLLDAAEQRELARLAEPPVLNSVGATVGRICACGFERGVQS